MMNMMMMMLIVFLPNLFIYVSSEVVDSGPNGEKKDIEYQLNAHYNQEVPYLERL